jgi:hypothetical protein
MFKVEVKIPAETLAALRDMNLAEADGPLYAVGNYVISNGMFAVFASHGEGTWRDVLRGGDPLDDTGALKGGFTYATGSDGKSIVIENVGRPKMIQWVQHNGMTIHAKEKGFPMRFRIGDRWVSKYQVTIPARQIFYWFQNLMNGAVEVAKTTIFERAKALIA